MEGGLFIYLHRIRDRPAIAIATHQRSVDGFRKREDLEGLAQMKIEYLDILDRLLDGRMRIPLPEGQSLETMRRLRGLADFDWTDERRLLDFYSILLRDY